MPHNVKNTLLLVGAGRMALEYSKVLKELKIAYEVVGRGQKSADVFKKQSSKAVFTGGLSGFLVKDATRKYSHAIVAVSVDQLSSATMLLLDKGIKHILVEKPAGLNAREIRAVAVEAKKKRARVYVAYNRRFYASVIKAKEIILEDEGVRSFNFEFTEWPHVIEGMDFSSEIKRHWFLANSTHVVDMAFFLGGKPQKISCYTTGGLKWHPSASVYAGAGITEAGALFSYQANWEAPGRWGVEILTKKHRLIFRPLEKLQIQKTGSVAIEFKDIDDRLDTEFKPGLYRQIQAFLDGDSQALCKIEERAAMTPVYNKIANY